MHLVTRSTRPAIVTITYDAAISSSRSWGTPTVLPLLLPLPLPSRSLSLFKQAGRQASKQAEPGSLVIETHKTLQWMQMMTPSKLNSQDKVSSAESLPHDLPARPRACCLSWALLDGGSIPSSHGHPMIDCPLGTELSRKDGAGMARPLVN